MEDPPFSPRTDDISVEEDHDSPTAQPLVGSLPFSATCIRIARDSYPNLRAMRSVTSMASLSDEGTGYKTVEGDHGYILEDVPHFTDYLPDLPTFTNPLQNHPAYKTVKQYWVNAEDSVPLKIVHGLNTPRGVHFRRAGPRQKVYFESDEVLPCIVTCGGLCPGLNTVIRELVCGLFHMYNVTKVLGIEGGYKGFYSSNTIELTPKSVNDIHKRGGTVIRTSRGGHDTIKIVDNIQDKGINQVYIIGGDGTQKGASDIYKEIRRRGLKVAVVGIPKTIDNDIAVIDKSFGFDSAVTEAQRAINAAHVEAESGENGIGLVKLMGRYSGFIAMYATLASRDVDCCLIPESPFYMEGKGGLYEFMEKRLKEYGHMVIVVAEGAGQKLIAQSAQSMDTADASGNRLLLDIGLWLSHKIKEHFSGKKIPINLKYIDPTYMIRAIPSNASDNVYCTLLAHSAIHGAMAGYTGFCVGQLNGRHTYIPFHRVIQKRNRVNISDRMWARLLSSTNQPSFMSAKDVVQEPRGEMTKPPSVPKLTNESSSSPKSPITPQKSVPIIEKTLEIPLLPKSPSVVLEPIIEKTHEKEEDEAPSPENITKQSPVELKSSDTDHPPHDSESDTQSEREKQKSESDTQSEREKQQNEKEKHEKQKSDDSSSASGSRMKPRSMFSFGRKKGAGWVESQVAALSPSRVSTPNGKGGDGNKDKGKDQSGKHHPWR